MILKTALGTVNLPKLWQNAVMVLLDVTNQVLLSRNCPTGRLVAKRERGIASSVPVLD